MSKHRRRNPLQIRVKPVRIPAGVKAPEFFEKLLAAVRHKRLPDDWDVELQWRNPETKRGRSREWQSGEFTEVLQQSRAGFSTVVYRVIRRAQARARGERLPRKRQELRAFLKRSRAAKQGWETRRRNIRAAARLHRKRSLAAKRGWQKRRK